jgi:hypothetical protein
VGIYPDFPSFAHFETRFTLNTPVDVAATYVASGFGRLNDFSDNIETSVAGHSGAFLVQRTFEVGIAEGLYFNYLDEDEVERVAKVLPSTSAIDFIVYVNYKYRKGSKIVSLLPDRYLIRFSFASYSIRVFQLGGMRRTPPSDVLLLASTQIDSGAQASGFQGAVFNIEGLEDSRKTEKIV